MPCTNPIDIPRYVFDSKHGGRIKRYFRYPCGKCLACLKVKQMQYAFRAEWEANDPSNLTVLFCTFTYSPEFLPPNNDLSKKDVQDFMRRLRLRFPGVRISYLFCGEYGDLRGRAHYHSILCFSDFVDYQPISDAWSKGIVDISPFTTRRGGYVAKYSVKQLGFDYSGHKQMPFLLVSNGFGFYFLRKYGDFCRKNFVGYWQNSSGAVVSLPRVFMERLFPPHDKLRFERSLSSPAAKSYYDVFASGIDRYRLIRRVSYESSLSSRSLLAGFGDDTVSFEGDVALGLSFQNDSKINAILNRVSYETGRYL